MFTRMVGAETRLKWVEGEREVESGGDIQSEVLHLRGIQAMKGNRIFWD